ncbi:MAG: efflux RND transporter periplasmic adaptor subunit, partial [Pseudomonadota bacterium]
DYLDRLVTRYEGLGEEAGESEASLDEMRANRDEARQALTQAEVALARAEVTLERTLVRAPFAGRVVNQEIQVGEFANPGTALVRLVDIQELEVTARAPATLVGNVAAGDAVTIRYGAESADAELRAVVPVGDERSRMLELRFALPQSNWFIGSAVRVALPAAAAKSVIAAPRDALVLRAERISVFVIGDDDTARQVDVELGVAQGEFIEVIGDIKAGDRLVIRGGERLRNGQTVRLDEAPGEPSA